MQLLQLLIPLTLLAQSTAAEATTSSAAATMTKAASPLPTSGGEDTLGSTRQGYLLPVIDIAKGVVDTILGIGGDINEKKKAWVNQTLDRIEKENPGYNVVVYHDKRSQLEPSPGGNNNNSQECQHFELGILLGIFTFGYEICAFEEGGRRFRLNGASNDPAEWNYRGCAKSNLLGDVVEFCDPKQKQQQPPTTASTGTNTSTAEPTNTGNSGVSRMTARPVAAVGMMGWVALCFMLL